MRKVANMAMAILVFGGVSYLIWTQTEDAATKANVQATQAKTQAKLLEVSETSCILDSADTEQWMAQMACSQKIKLLIGFSDIVGEYPDMVSYTMATGIKVKVPSLHLYYRMRLQ